MKEGCTWRTVPHDFPKWQNVRCHYDIWAEPDENGISLLDWVLRRLVEAERKKNGRENQTTRLLVDPKSIQTADAAEKKGMTLEKTSGIKLHFGVDVPGFPHAITTANMTDRSGAIDMVGYYCGVSNHLSLVKKLLADGGYTGENFANEIKNLSGAEVAVVKRNELHTFAVLPKR